MSEQIVSVIEGMCLSLVGNGATHGYDIAQHFAP